MSRIYVYALVEQRARSLRIGNRAIRFVECRRASIGNRQSAIGNIYAAVEHLARAPELSESALKLQHEILAGLARRFDAILPARFGAFIEQQELFHIVQLRREILREGLASVRGHEQMTVRIFGGAPQTSRGLTANTTGTAYLERRRSVQRGPLPAVAERIRTSVGTIATRECVEPGRSNVRAVLHHLIPKGRSADYIGLVENAAAGSREERVTVSGPFAPFAFTPDIWA
jgi:hypothetical protein